MERLGLWWESLCVLLKIWWLRNVIGFSSVKGFFNVSRSECLNIRATERLMRSVCNSYKNYDNRFSIVSRIRYSMWVIWFIFRKISDIWHFQDVCHCEIERLKSVILTGKVVLVLNVSIKTINTTVVSVTNFTLSVTIILNRTRSTVHLLIHPSTILQFRIIVPDKRTNQAPNCVTPHYMAFTWNNAKCNFQTSPPTMGASEC